MHYSLTWENNASRRLDSWIKSKEAVIVDACAPLHCTSAVMRAMRSAWMRLRLR